MASVQQAELESELRGIKLSIEFKEFLLNKDIHSRYIILDKCTEWFRLEYISSQNQSVQACYIWFQNAKLFHQNADSETRKEVLKSSILWDELHHTHSKCLAFQKLINFILHGVSPSDDLR